MIIPQEIAKRAQEKSLRMMDIMNEVEPMLKEAEDLLDTMSKPCEGYLEYRNQTEKLLLNASAALNGEFPNLASSIGVEFKNAFESIATTRDYESIDLALVEGEKIPMRCTDKPVWKEFVPGRFIYRMEQSKDEEPMMELIDGCCRTVDTVVEDAVLVFANTILQYDIMCKNNGQASYERVLDPIPGLLGELEKATQIVHKVIEFIMSNDLAAFHAGAGADDPVIRERVAKCNVIYGMNIEHIREVAQRILRECGIRAYCLKPICETSELVDRAYNAYIQHVGGARW